MTVNPAAAARVIPLTAPFLAARASEKTYEQQTQQLQQARAQSAAELSQINKMQGANA